MRTVIAILVVLAAIAAALYGVGFVGPSTPPDEPNGLDRPDVEDPDGGGLEPGSTQPEVMPPLEALSVSEPLRVLLLAGYAERLPATLAQHWGNHPAIEVTAWVQGAGAEGAGSGSPEATALRNVTVLDAMPVPADLPALEIDVLALHGLDASALGDAFWDEVDMRVRDGRMGLLVMPGRPEGQGLFDQPTLRALLPVAKVSRMEGDPIPGVLGAFRPYEVTDDGVSHPASRLVAFPEWSRTFWRARAEDEFPWGTAHTWPVDETAEASATLLRVVPPRGDPLPVLIAGQAGSGRVLFFGGFALLPRLGYGRPAVMQDIQTWLRNMLIWTAGRD